MVYNYAFTDGIPHSSCLQYTARNINNAAGCQPMDICRDCQPPACPADKSYDECMDGCTPVNFTKHYVTNYYGLRGADQMKAELFANGPISCGIQSTKKFHNYTGGVYREFISNPQMNHEIAVVGWGRNATSGEEYWVGRNSWGTYWGEFGFFRVPIGDKTVNLGIQLDCTAGTPSFTPSPASPAAKKEGVVEIIQ